MDVPGTTMMPGNVHVVFPAIHFVVCAAHLCFCLKVQGIRFTVPLFGLGNHVYLRIIVCHFSPWSQKNTAANSGIAPTDCRRIKTVRNSLFRCYRTLRPRLLRPSALLKFPAGWSRRSIKKRIRRAEWACQALGRQQSPGRTHSTILRVALLLPVRLELNHLHRFTPSFERGNE